MTQVLAGVLATVWVYPTLVRWAVWRWLAAAAGLPALLGAAALADPGAASAALAVGCGVALALLCRDRRPSVPVAGWAVAALVTGTAGWLFLRPDRPSWDASSVAGLLLVVVPTLVALVASAGAGRASASAMRLVCALPLVVSAGALSAGDALVALAWCPAAGALGLTALLRGRRSPSAAAPQTDAVDDAILAVFTPEHGVRLGPVVVVIATYNEADGLPRVLRSLPAEACGLHVDVLVVDDGSTDGTAEAAVAAGGTYVAACPVNRGQGAALRLGYRIAVQHGAAYVVTTDADGQYAADEIASVLAPIVDGRADFVTGSRRLGVLENRDAVRQAGTYAFAWLASALLGRHITDTSFGLRAMRAGVTAGVTLNQPQYQASELLVGVFSHGFRYAEVPATMRVRSAGTSKKGGNLAYGARYARVMLGTWWREGCPRPVAETAPALRGSLHHAAVDVDA